MYNFECTLNSSRMGLILTSGEFLTHKIKAKGIKITKNLELWPFEVVMIFAPLNNNDCVVERSLTNFAWNNGSVTLNFGDGSTTAACVAVIAQKEYSICFNNVSDEYTGEFFLFVHKLDEDWDYIPFTDEDIELVKNSITVEPTDVFDYKGWYCTALETIEPYLDEDYDDKDTGMALLPPTNDPNSSMSFIYRVPPNKQLQVPYDGEEYNHPIDYFVFEGDSLIGYNGMFENVEYFRYCLPMWSPLLLRHYNDDLYSYRIAPDNPIQQGTKAQLYPGDVIYHNTTDTNKGVVINIPKYGYKFELAEGTN